MIIILDETPINNNFFTVVIIRNFIKWFLNPLNIEPHYRFIADKNQDHNATTPIIQIKGKHEFYALSIEFLFIGVLIQKIDKRESNKKEYKEAEILENYDNL